MTSFEKELFSTDDYDILSLVGGFKFSVFSGKFCVLEGHTGIKKYEQTEIIFKIKRRYVKIIGDGLYIKQMTKNFAVVAGEINSCEVSNG
ncbi:MAG TPA: YabP/YqfC family sporulation protein [Eubacteriales bacterium]|nr:YabP/YqfC family sporulation protein [Eubacteriales bacterium]